MRVIELINNQFVTRQEPTQINVLVLSMKGGLGNNLSWSLESNLDGLWRQHYWNASNNVIKFYYDIDEPWRSKPVDRSQALEKFKEVQPDAVLADFRLFDSNYESPDASRLELTSLLQDMRSAKVDTNIIVYDCFEHNKSGTRNYIKELSEVANNVISAKVIELARPAYVMGLGVSVGPIHSRLLGLSDGVGIEEVAADLRKMANKIRAKIESEFVNNER